MMTLEQISEKIRDHLIAQKARSIGELGISCKYRGHNGMMCAVGCLITDEVYDSTGGIIEGECADASSVHQALVDSLGFQFTEAVEKMLLNWQAYHDDYACLRFVAGSPTLSYKRWLSTDEESDSPEALHKFIMSGDLK